MWSSLNLVCVRVSLVLLKGGPPASADVLGHGANVKAPLQIFCYSLFTRMF